MKQELEQKIEEEEGLLQGGVHNIMSMSLAEAQYTVKLLTPCERVALCELLSSLEQNRGHDWYLPGLVGTTAL